MDEPTFVAGHTEYEGVTTVQPLGLAVLILLGIAVVLLPRKHALIAIMICASFISMGQRIVLFSLDFNYLRILLLFGWFRILARQEYQKFTWNSLDWWVIGLAVSGTAIYPIHNGISGFVFKLGQSFDAVGTYFLARLFLRDLSDTIKFVENAAIISLPVAFFFTIEYSTQHNIFAIFGGVPEFTVVREGKLRCQGAYVHPILAGCFWAALTPMMMARILAPGIGRIVAAIGLVAALGIVMMCASSTPMMGVIAGVAGLLLFRFRTRLWVFRWGCVALLVVLHFSMKQPVWHLVSRTDFVGGSTGWHRFNLIDNFINRYHEWIMFGSADITHWGVFANDVTNQYCLEGIRGGGLTLAAFLGLIVVALRNVGRLWRDVERDGGEVLQAWGIGVSLFVHTVNFVGVSYFGQIELLWSIGLAMTAVAPTPVRRIRRRFLPQSVVLGSRREVKHADYVPVDDDYVSTGSVNSSWQSPEVPSRSTRQQRDSSE